MYCAFQCRSKHGGLSFVTHNGRQFGAKLEHSSAAFELTKVQQTENWQANKLDAIINTLLSFVILGGLSFFFSNGSPFPVWKCMCMCVFSVSRGRWCAQYSKLLFNDKVACLAAAILASNTKTTICNTNKDWLMTVGRLAKRLKTVLPNDFIWAMWVYRLVRKVQSHRFNVFVSASEVNDGLLFIGISDATEGIFDR